MLPAALTLSLTSAGPTVALTDVVLSEPGRPISGAGPHPTGRLRDRSLATAAALPPQLFAKNKSRWISEISTASCGDLQELHLRLFVYDCGRVQNIICPFLRPNTTCYFHVKRIGHVTPPVRHVRSHKCFHSNFAIYVCSETSDEAPHESVKTFSSI